MGSERPAVPITTDTSVRRAALAVVAHLVWVLPCVLLMAATPTRGQAPPQRIISLVPALTEMLFAISAGPQVVAVSSFDTDSSDVRDLPRVGALVDPDTERILSLRPDLVVTYGSQTDLKAQLARAGIATFEYRHGGLADVFATMRELGDRVGHRADADRVATDIESRIARVRAAVAGRPRPRVLLVFGRERGALRNIYVSGRHGFLHDMLLAAGGENAMEDVDREAVQVSTEQILARRPDAILELRSNMTPQGDVAADIASWGALASVPAVANHRVHILTGPSLVVPGPRVVDGIERMARALHPDAFPAPGALTDRP